MRQRGIPGFGQRRIIVDPPLATAMQTVEQPPGRFRTPAQSLWKQDMLPYAALVARMGRDAIVPLADLIDRLTARNLPPQLVQGSYLAQFTANNAPQIVIPKNPNRYSWLISAIDGTDSWAWSYDAPIPSAIAGGFVGVPQSGATAAFESNGTVSINDIYGWMLNSAAFPRAILGYEGTLSAVGNKP